jgi:hypothetical protein
MKSNIWYKGCFVCGGKHKKEVCPKRKQPVAEVRETSGRDDHLRDQKESVKEKEKEKGKEKKEKEKDAVDTKAKAKGGSQASADKENDISALNVIGVSESGDKKVAHLLKKKSKKARTRTNENPAVNMPEKSCTVDSLLATVDSLLLEQVMAMQNIQADTNEDDNDDSDLSFGLLGSGCLSEKLFELDDDDDIYESSLRKTKNKEPSQCLGCGSLEHLATSKQCPDFGKPRLRVVTPETGSSSVTFQRGEQIRDIQTMDIFPDSKAAVEPVSNKGLSAPLKPHPVIDLTALADGSWQLNVTAIVTTEKLSETTKLIARLQKLVRE